jgi:hypothetical protein
LIELGPPSTRLVTIVDTNWTTTGQQLLDNNSQIFG